MSEGMASERRGGWVTFPVPLTGADDNGQEMTIHAAFTEDSRAEDLWVSTMLVTYEDHLYCWRTVTDGPVKVLR